MFPEPDTNTLFPLPLMVVQFNYFPSSYADESWWSAFKLMNIYKKLAKRPQTHRRLSRALLEQLKISGQYDFDFDHKTKKLALLPASDLRRLIRVLGLVSHSAQLRRIVLGSELKRLHEFVSKEDHSLALRLSFACEGRFPPVSAELSQDGLVGAIASHVEERGLSILDKAFGAGLSGAFVKRFLLKMPKHLDGSHSQDFANVPLRWLENFAVKTMVSMNPKWRTLLS